MWIAICMRMNWRTYIKKLKQELGINHVTLQAECERGRNDKMIVPGRGNNEN